MRLGLVAILSAFRNNELEQAGERMAVRDQSYGTMIASLAGLGERVSAIQKVQFRVKPNVQRDVDSSACSNSVEWVHWLSLACRTTRAVRHGAQ